MSTEETKTPFSRFEVEVETLGKKYIVRGKVELHRVGRGKKEIVAEAWFNDTCNSMEFRNRCAESYPKALEMIFDQIDYRGFLPLRYRIFNTKWAKWEEIHGYPKDELLKEALAGQKKKR